MSSSVKIHKTADVAPGARIGDNTSIWNQCQVREDVSIGQNCILGKDVYVDFGVSVGDNVKIQNGALLYHGLAVESGVFIGPGAIFTNDYLPRAINSDGSLKDDSQWSVGESRVEYGASIGAGAVILPGICIGRFALVGAGAVVTTNVPAHGLVVGNPSRLIGYVCACANRLSPAGPNLYHCAICKTDYTIQE